MSGETSAESAEAVREVERAAFFAGNRVYLLAADAAKRMVAESPESVVLERIMRAAAALTDLGMTAVAVEEPGP